MQKLVWQNSIGNEIDLTTNPYGITEWEGFSNASLNIQSQQVPFQDGGVFLDALIEQRELSVTLAMNDGGNLEARYRMRRELVHALNPKLGEGYLIYTNNFISKRIKCVPQIPLFETHNSNDSGTPKASLAWTACEPYWEDLEETEIMLESGVINKIENNGDVKCALKVDFYNVEGKDIKIENQNKKIELNGTYNQVVNVNTESGQKSIYQKELEGKIKSIGYCNSICFNKAKNYFVLASSFACIITKDFKDFEIYINTLQIEKIYYFEETEKHIGVGSDFIAISDDGKNWTEIAVDKYIRKIIFVNNKYIGIATSSGNTYIYESEDGLNWNITEVEGIALKDFLYCKEQNKYYAINSQAIYTSTNLENWTQVRDYSGYTLFYISYISDIAFVVVARYTDIQSLNYLAVFYSYNGSAWNSATLGDNYRFTGTGGTLIGIKGKGFYFLNNGNVYNSVVGEYWEKIKQFEDSTLTKMDYFNILGDFITYGIVSICYKTLLTDQINVIAIGAYRDIVFSKKTGKYILVTEHKIFESFDLTSWKLVYTYSNQYYLKKAVYFEDKELFIVTTDYRYYLVSSNGSDWETIEYNANTFYINANSITYIKDLKKVYVVGKNIYNNGVVVFTEDGLNWESGSEDSIPSLPFPELKTLAYSKKYNLLILIGNNKNYTSIDEGVKWHFKNTTDVGGQLFYNDYLKKAFTPSFVTTNCDSWTKINNKEITTFCYSSYHGLFLGIKGNKLYLSYDVQEWGEITLSVNSITALSDIKCIDDKNFILIGTVSNRQFIMYLEFVNAENIINNLSADSDMDFNLEVGINNIRILNAEGYLQARIAYRQKYIGV